MKTILQLFLLTSLLITLPRTSVRAQTAPEVEGDLIATGPLLLLGKVAGHFQLTDNRQIGQEDFVYTLTLLGNDLQPLGSKVYETETALNFEDIAYNGENLGVMYKTNGPIKQRVVQLLNNAGEEVRRKILPSAREDRGLFLLPTRRGFVAGSIRQQIGDYIWQLDMIPTDGETEAWKVNYAHNQYTRFEMPRVLDADNDRLLLSVKRIESSGVSHYRDIVGFDLRDGKELFRADQEKSRKEAYVQGVIDGALTADGAVVVQHVPNYRRAKEEMDFRVRRFGADGEVITDRTFVDETLVASARKDLGLAPFTKDNSAVRTGLLVSQEGLVQAVYEEKSGRDATGKRFAGHEYGDGYVVVVGADDRRAATQRIEKDHFVLLGDDANGVMGSEVTKLRRRLRKGKFDKLRLEELVSLHDGPYGYAMGVAGGDYLSSFFFDRDFTEDGVVYKGIRVATFLDGEFEMDYIPIKDAPDFIEVKRAREGYLRLTSYKYGEGMTASWLERLSY